jgi:hypothetical protein
VLLLVTRVHGRRLQPARLLAGPLILIAIGIGIGSSAPELHSTTLHGVDYLIGSIDLLDSLIIGTIRGFTIRLYQRDGAPWYRVLAPPGEHHATGTRAGGHPVRSENVLSRALSRSVEGVSRVA